MGPTAVLEVKGVNIVVASYPTYEQAGEQFVAAGIDPWQYKFVVVKNPMNFQKAFEKAPVHYHLDTSGPTTCRINEAQWKHLDRPIYPLDDGFEPVFEGF